MTNKIKNLTEWSRKAGPSYIHFVGGLVNGKPFKLFQNFRNGWDLDTDGAAAQVNQISEKELRSIKNRMTREIAKSRTAFAGMGR